MCLYLFDPDHLLLLAYQLCLEDLVVQLDLEILEYPLNLERLVYLECLFLEHPVHPVNLVHLVHLNLIAEDQQNLDCLDYLDDPENLHILEDLDHHQNLLFH